MRARAAGATISNADLVAQLRARAEAKNRRDFPTADAIRSALEAHGIKITDVRAPEPISHSFTECTLIAYE